MTVPKTAIVYFLLLISMPFCRQPLPLTGKWKFLNVKTYSEVTSDTIRINLKDTLSIIKLNMERPPQKILSSDDLYFVSLMQNTFLELKDDRSFYLQDIGMLVRDRNTQNTKGKWIYNLADDRLVLEQSDPKMTVDFKIVKLSTDTLMLEEWLANGTRPMSEITLTK